MTPEAAERLAAIKEQLRAVHDYYMKGWSTAVVDVGDLGFLLDQLDDRDEELDKYRRMYGTIRPDVWIEDMGH